MTLEIISSDKVQVLEQVESWREAINIAASPLQEQGYFQQDYIDDMIRSVEKLGPYIVIAPEIAIAHARPNNNVKKIGLSLLKLNQHINFSEEGHYASLVFVLSAIDNEGHLEVLRSLATTLGNQQTVKNLLNAQTSSEIINIFKGE
ncbi:PTS sugar transporter subunit IIA [Staphylococcus cohnii]|uniref:PTS sugar transporter subunit IIA n=1 Tax=Staphylococcus TaxID=1279 RepID=UPI000D1BA488|nr:MULTISPECIES: PTS sugar transporter subunit IIA [Staphylococcus]MBB2507015.1 Ascorbate-specific PTS system EIIA component [Staphylococcus cohnii subsp. barensis]PTF07138.1 PTS ascorbate transporter subunit IIA [Staphylococcus cohnii]PTG68757.1 PTS ascorbate transporter subunit IIA [Staphylococcus cohnii]RIL76748.1 PTS sugar transporter subunit IIA [Staphylococcus cohnii]